MAIKYIVLRGHGAVVESGRLVRRQWQPSREGLVVVWTGAEVVERGLFGM